MGAVDHVSGQNTESILAGSRAGRCRRPFRRRQAGAYVDLGGQWFTDLVCLQVAIVIERITFRDGMLIDQQVRKGLPGKIELQYLAEGEIDFPENRGSGFIGIRREFHQVLHIAFVLQGVVLPFFIVSGHHEGGVGRAVRTGEGSFRFPLLIFTH